MAVNTKPIYTGIGNFGWGGTLITTANTAKDGTGTVLTVFTANATNGGYLKFIRFRSAGTNAATVARVFVNNGATNATPANNILFDEITLVATTLSEQAALPMFQLPFGHIINPGYKINITIGFTIAAGYYVSAPGGDYEAQA